MKTRKTTIVSALFICALISACGPSPEEQAATVTQVAANIFATLTAQAPTATTTFTPNPTLTATPTAIATPTATTTPTATATEQAEVALAATQAAANADLMKYVTENTRHYKGDPNAPVTIIEFSDYQ